MNAGKDGTPLHCWWERELVQLLVVVVVKNPPANAGDKRDTSSIPESGRSPGERHGNSLQHSCLENPMDRGAWWATVHRVTKNQTQLKHLSTHHSEEYGSFLKKLKIELPHDPDSLFMDVYLEQNMI